MRGRIKKSRREFLATVGQAATGMALAPLNGCFPDVGGIWPRLQEACMEPDEGAAKAESPRVVEMHRGDSIIETVEGNEVIRREVNNEVVRPMLEDLLVALTDGASDPWRTIFPDYTSAMRIGIKVNCLNEMVPTSVALVKALVDSLRESLDIDARRVIVWDRRLDELVLPAPRKLFVADELGAQVVGTLNSARSTYGPGYTDPICGNVAGRLPRFSRILAEMTDVTINCPVLKTHNVSGVTAALKNIYGVIDNPGEYHSNLNQALPALYNLPPIRDRIRLTILDALIAVTTGDTDAPPDTYPRRIIASRDPIALDRYSVDLVNSLRAEKNLDLPDVDASTLDWLDIGQDLGLGSLNYELHQLVDDAET